MYIFYDLLSLDSYECKNQPSKGGKKLFPAHYNNIASHNLYVPVKYAA